MNLSSDNPDLSDLKEAFLLLSRQLDSDFLTSAEEQRLQDLMRRFPGQTQQFQTEIQDLGRLLQSIPVSHVSDQLAIDVQDQIALATLPRVRGRAGYWLPMLAVVAAAVLLMTIKPFEPSAGERVAHSSAPVRAEMADSAADSGWNVVVVKVESDDRQKAMHEIENVVDRYGLSLQNQTGDDKAEWLGVVLTSASTQDSQILTALENGVADSSIDLDPHRVANASPEEIIAVVQRALAHPTQSEQLHGRIYVALPRIDSGAGESLVADAKAGSSLEPELSAENAVTHRAESAGPAMASAGLSAQSDSSRLGRMTLVVFEFVAPSSSNGSAGDHKI